MIVVFLVTCWFSFGVQFCFYVWYRFHRPQFLKNHQHVLQYISGIIGDGLLVPLTNVVAIETLQQIERPIFSMRMIGFSFLSGMVITFLFHKGQQYFKLTNWTMPKVGVWNLLGFYHALFMFFESSFLVLTLSAFLESVRLHGSIQAYHSPIRYGFSLLFIFFLSFVFDYWKTLFKKLFIQRKRIQKAVLLYLTNRS